MGVYGLWDILLTVAQKCPIQKLSGRVLAIDASIWVIKISSIYSDNKQRIRILLDKIAILKRNNILPIFVFDGIAPAIKRKTQQERRRKKYVSNDIETKKKVEIEVVKMLTNENQQEVSQSQSRKSMRREQQLEQINQNLEKLAKVNQQYTLTTDLLQKIELQNQILSKKYKYMLEVDPQYHSYENFLQQQEFKVLQILQKQFYIKQLENYKWRNGQLFVFSKQKTEMNEDQKLQDDLKKIEKRNTVRVLQDQLYRNTMNNSVKIENGYEIIEGVYDGRKVVQKRKIKDSKKSKKAKYEVNMSSFYNNNQESDKEQQPDNFLKKFCCTEIAQKQSDDDQKLFTQDKPRLSQKFSPQKQEFRQAELKNSQLDEQDFFSNKEKQIINFINPSSQSNSRKSQQRSQRQEQNQNKDHLPDFKQSEGLNYQSNSQDNLQLQNLLTVLGLPFVISPGQAQAQCASLEKNGIVDGIITEDSDTFLFGGRNVIRGVFKNDIKYYNLDRIHSKIRLNRQKMIIFALLMGSDYTQGVRGIGMVNSMQIVRVFDQFDKLQRFKKWAQRADILLSSQQRTQQVLKDATQLQAQFYTLHKKFKNYWFIQPSFPSQNVINQYFNPNVIQDSQIKLMKQRHLFSQKQVKIDLLNEVLTKLEMHDKEMDHYRRLLTIKYRKPEQTTITQYFVKKDREDELANVRSKRLQKSLSLGFEK